MSFRQNVRPKEVCSTTVLIAALFLGLLAPGANGQQGLPALREPSMDTMGWAEREIALQKIRHAERLMTLEALAKRNPQLPEIRKLIAEENRDYTARLKSLQNLIRPTKPLARPEAVVHEWNALPLPRPIVLTRDGELPRWIYGDQTPLDGEATPRAVNPAWPYPETRWLYQEVPYEDPRLGGPNRYALPGERDFQNQRENRPQRPPLDTPPATK